MSVVQKAKEQGDFLLVGLHTDEDVAERRGPHLPIMDLHERCLSVLACKYVDEAIIGIHSRPPIGKQNTMHGKCSGPMKFVRKWEYDALRVLI